jgi:hypothetical protein
MKRNPTSKFCGLALAASLLGGASLAYAQTTDTNLNAFATSYGSVNNTEGITPVGCGSSWGNGSFVWDNSQLYPGTSGSGYVIAGFSAGDSSGTPVIDYICFPPYDNWYWNGNGNVDLSQYSAVQFEILWDTNSSSMPIDQFNNPSLYQASLASSYQGLEIDYSVGSGDAGAIGSTNIPDAASNGWVTVTVPIPSTLSPTAGTCGIFLHKWINNESTLVGNPTANFWIANVQLLGTSAPPPPPIVQSPTTPSKGLNIFASTEGNSFYDRQQVALVASNGVSWVGNATTANPVTYSFTIDGFPQNSATEYACEAYLMMAPNPAAYDKAIDYNEANCVVIELEQGNGSTVMNFQYKINSPNSEPDTTIGNVTNNGTALGNWSVAFTSDTNVTMTAPNGSTSSFIFTNGASFAETQSPGCYLYLGMQANNQASLNQAVSYSNFSLTGVPAALSDNFLTDTTLNTNLWYNFVATAPAGAFVMPTNAEYWLTWNLPASGYQLQYANNLLGAWTIPTDDLIIYGAGANYQLVTTNDVPAGTSSAFFELANP